MTSHSIRRFSSSSSIFSNPRILKSKSFIPPTNLLCPTIFQSNSDISTSLSRSTPGRFVSNGISFSSHSFPRHFTPSFSSSSSLSLSSSSSSLSLSSHSPSSFTPSSPSSPASFPTRPSVLIYGGGGSLGNSIVNHFNSLGYLTFSVDFLPSPICHKNFLLDKNVSWKNNTTRVMDSLEEYLREENELSSQQSTAAVANHKNIIISTVICAAGGWKGDDVMSANLFDNFDVMVNLNLHSAISAAHLAKKFLSPNGLVVFTGAAAALQGTPDNFSYGVSKAAVHHIAITMAKYSQQQQNHHHPIHSICILPLMLDTPSNRHFAKVEKDNVPHDWTPTEAIAEAIGKWAEECKEKGKGKGRGKGKEAENNKNKSDDSHDNSSSPSPSAPISHIPELVNGGFYQFNTKDWKTKIEVKRI